MQVSCVTCDIIFNATNPKQKYCSRKCLRKVARQKHHGNQSLQTCEYCLVKFQPHTDKPQRFCSKRCGLLNRWNSPSYVASIPCRFWSYVEKGDYCWEWKANRNKKDYGGFSVAGRRMPAHRYSWELHYGTIPHGLFVCHHCDNPRCVRPDHLFLGTHQDNTDDMVRKNRQAQGTRSPSSKLTPDDIRAIRLSSLGTRALGRLYGVSHSTIGSIIHGRKWKHII